MVVCFSALVPFSNQKSLFDTSLPAVSVLNQTDKLNIYLLYTYVRCMSLFIQPLLRENKFTYSIAAYEKAAAF